MLTPLCRITLGNTSYILPKVPSLYTALTVGKEATNPAVYGAATNPVVINKGDIIQVVVRTHDAFAHPMHLHGHRFQLVARGPGDWNGDNGQLPQSPVVRDTATTVPFGHLVFRFKADNPGVWPLHCHMEWHVEQGQDST
jgi:iron transport multicopper oxidase